LGIDHNLSIDYANDSQTSIGGTLGFARGSVLLFAYASEVTRHFDVRVTRGEETFTQKDEQGMLRYGLGMEVAPFQRFHLRVRVGGGRADFGDAQTNIEPARPVQFSIGIAYQF
jgi:hypothetical protein